MGVYLNLILGVSRFTTELEDAADLVAEDLESESQRCVGEKVRIKRREKGRKG